MLAKFFVKSAVLNEHSDVRQAMALLKHHLETYEFDSLQAAMTFAKKLNAFVTIQFDGLEVVGVFGAAGIVNGKCPDGIDYSWKKRRR